MQRQKNNSTNTSKRRRCQSDDYTLTGAAFKNKRFVSAHVWHVPHLSYDAAPLLADAPD